MKILAFTDIHAEDVFLKSIAKQAEKADILLCPGDFTIFMEGFDKVIKAFIKLKKPVLLLHGNHEDEEEVDNLKKPHIIPIHKKPYVYKDYIFLGHGGGGFSFRDKELEKRMPQFKKQATKAKKVILITHAPPFGTELDYLPWAGHVGCKTINEAIKILKPQFYFCGHIHESFGIQDKLGKTLMTNPGPEGMIIEI
tara:strand:- start:1003 stop:1590 length:588 start_codon:yes stop_codon:yes gene_type:complete